MPREQTTQNDEAVQREGALMTTAIKKTDNAPERCAPSDGSASVGPGQVRAATIWQDLNGDELRYVDILEMCAVLMLNVAEKSQSTDHEVATMTRRLMHDARGRARTQSDKVLATKGPQ